MNLANRGSVRQLSAAQYAEFYQRVTQVLEGFVAGETALEESLARISGLHAHTAREVSIQDWAAAGLPLARTLLALNNLLDGANADVVATESAQDVREVRVQLEEFLLPNGLAVRSVDGRYTLTQTGRAKLNGHASGERSATLPRPPREIHCEARPRKRSAASARKYPTIGNNGRAAV